MHFDHAGVTSSSSPPPLPPPPPLTPTPSVAAATTRTGARATSLPSVSLSPPVSLSREKAEKVETKPVERKGSSSSSPTAEEDDDGAASVRSPSSSPPLPRLSGSLPSSVFSSARHGAHARLSLSSGTANSRRRSPLLCLHLTSPRTSGRTSPPSASAPWSSPSGISRDTSVSGLVPTSIRHGT